MTQKLQKVDVEVEKHNDIDDYSYSISSYSKEIKHDIEAILNGNTKLLNNSFGNVKYYSKDFPLKRYPLAIGLGVEIYPLRDAIEVGVEIGTTELRYLNREKAKFNRLSSGKHVGNVFLLGYWENPFIIKNTGSQKFKVFDRSAGRTGVDCRIYETFTKKYFIRFEFTVFVYAGERPLKENDETGEIVFNNVMQSDFNEIEEIISGIKWK